MNLIITGRVFKGRNLIGYKAWKCFNGKINNTPIYFYKNEIARVFHGYNVLNCELKSNRVTSKILIPIIEYPRYDSLKNLCATYGNTDSVIIAVTLGINVEDVRIFVCSALIKVIVSGGITDIYSDEASLHADLYYEEIRHMTTDVGKIAQNTGLNVKDIIKIKNYLFMNQHNLGGGYKQFDSSFEIAQTWQRLMTNTASILPHDYTMLKHELLEMSLVAQGKSQSEAHDIASKKYNYSKESGEYYAKIKRNHP